MSSARAAVAFSLGTLFFAYAFVQRVAPSVMTDELMRDYAVGGAALGSLSAFYFYAYAAIQLPVGMLTDRFGPRKLMSFAAALCALATLTFAFSDSLWMASLGRALIGGTVAFAFVGTLAIAGYWFRPARFAMLAGLVQSVGMAGAVFGQAPLRELVDSSGWRATVAGLAGIALLLAVAIYSLVPRRTREQADHAAPTGLLRGLGAVAASPQNWVCSAIGFCMASGMLAFGGLWGVPWLHQVHGYGKTEAAAMTSMVFVGWAIFSTFNGWLSDRIGRRNVILQGGAALMLLALATLIYLTPASTVARLALIFAVGAGGSAMTVCFGSVRELNPLANSSTAVGMMNMCVVGSGAVMQPLIGLLLDRQWTGELANGARIYSAEAWVAAFSSLVVLAAAAIVAGLLLRETYCRQLR